MKKLFRYLVCTLSAFVLVGLGACALILLRSLPVTDGEIEFASLTAPVSIDSDRYGIPLINADNRSDAIRALGFVTARDRLFQMDVMRRMNAGRLAEILGKPAVTGDIRARILGFEHVARAVVRRLPSRYRHYLAAYADGVNRFIDQAKEMPFEFTVLAYRPERWRPEDSILVALGMFDLLTGWAEREERMLSVMENALPRALVSFLTPASDPYTDQLLHPSGQRRLAPPIPAGEMSKLLAEFVRAPDSWPQTDSASSDEPVPASNAWLVAPKKTADGRTILANDMHLGISVPAIWYRAQLRYGTTQTAGVALPGLPFIIAGSNRHIAWGETNLSGDFLDLVRLEINPDNPEEYRDRGQWRRFLSRYEMIGIKGSQTMRIKVRETVWGPVSNEPLLGNAVAVHWTALDDAAFTMGLIDLEEAETMTDALAAVRGSGGPQLNMLLADDRGHIAWTLMGNIPVRVGGDGSVSRSWADGDVGWKGYAQTHAIPLEVDPPEGFLVSANHRRFGRNDPHAIGRQFANGYRASRISRQLERKAKFDEQSMFALQLDTRTEFYDFYRDLALSVLSAEALRQAPELVELRDAIRAWNGHAGVESPGLPLLVEFRKRLAKSVFHPFLAACRRQDKHFSYSWTYIDTPLQTMLTEKIPELLPDPLNHRNWDAFILARLQEGARRLKRNHSDIPLSRLTWGEVNRARFGHPLSRALPILGVLLDMPAERLAGCLECVRVATPHFAASERLVVSPAHWQDAILQIPGGQSGHPLSSHYSDQYDAWVKGMAIPFVSGKARHRLVLKNPGDERRP
ncbi:MAG: penicillin acylase family protein [Gammaproteobacteria bacterium]